MPLDVIIPFHFKHLFFGLHFTFAQTQTSLSEWQD